MKPAATNFFCASWVIGLALGVAIAPAAVGRAAPAATTATATSTAPTRTTRPATAPVLRDLLVHGTNDYLWAADVVLESDAKTPSAKTTVRFRTIEEAQWRSSAQLEATARSLGSRGRELLVALAGGEWAIVADDGARSGLSLPGGAEVLALTGDGDDLWAVAAAPKSRAYLDPPRIAAAPATRTAPPAATAPSATATAPSSSAATTTTAPVRALPPHDLGLFRLLRGSWEEVDALPTGVRRDDLISVSLMRTDRSLLLAVATDDLAVRVYSRAPDSSGGWAGGDEPVAVLPADGRIKLMSYDGLPLLWLAEPNAPGTILLGSAPPPVAAADTGDTRVPRWKPPVRLQAPRFSQPFDRRALAVALGRIRLIATDGKGRIAEQIYELNGVPVGTPTEAVSAPVPSDNRIAPAVELLVLLILFLSMIGAMRQRPHLAEAVRNLDRLHLAPLSRRFAGGLVDALPLLVCGYIGLSATNAPGHDPSAPVTLASHEVRWVGGGIVLYLAHTMLLELLTARSLGKFVTGTRVAALDGSVPRVTAILIRNFLRPLDVLLLVLLYLSPLRQRVGDMAAGTLVVLVSPPPVRDPDEPTPSDDKNGKGGDVAASGPTPSKSDPSDPPQTPSSSSSS